MKRILLTIPVVLSLAACKKSYTCVCITTSVMYHSSTSSYQTDVNQGTDAPYSQKMTKKQAKAACKHEETAIQTDFMNGYTNSGNRPLKSGESITTSCLLK